MTKKIILALFLLLVICYPLSGKIYAADYSQIQGIMHIKSNISDGAYSIEEIAKKAKDKGISVVFITDHYLMKWVYGIFPLRSLIKRTVEDNSVNKFGVKRYLELINSAQDKYPGIIIIPGIECAPFYYWEGSLFKRDLKLRAWHRHILVVGLESPRDYDGLPLVSNHKSKFDQYHGDKWYKPYQDLIDYVNKAGGMAFWAHPEVENSDKIKGILIHTLPYPDFLLKTDGYAGFGFFHEGYRVIGRPGGSWDTILNEYCDRKRAKPIWAMGEVDYLGRESESISSVKNVFLVEEKSKTGILEALKRGRFYVVTSAPACELRLDEFSLSDINGSRKAVMGEEIGNAGKALVAISISSKKEAEKAAKIMLIKDGKLFKVYNERLPFKVSFEDEISRDTPRKSYYRLDVSCQGSRLISNPIFRVNDF